MPHLSSTGRHSAERPPLTSAGEYRIAGGAIVQTRHTKDGPVDSQLCNFAADLPSKPQSMTERSVSSVWPSRGAARRHAAASRRNSCQGLRPHGMGRAKLGHSCSGLRRRGDADHLAALQLLSGDVPRRVVYGHLGWRRLGDQWGYLHAGGAIGCNGPIDGVEVAPPNALARYVLPAPPDDERLRQAVRASLDLLYLAPERIAFALLASVYRSVLGDTDFAVHLMGQTGVFKSEYAALLQSHFGRGMDRTHLPASWASTGYALEGVAFACKDALLVVDDFAPQGGVADVARLHREAERLLRRKVTRAAGSAWGGTLP